MTELLLQYAIYCAIIVVGLFVLGIIKRSTRLPSHKELKKRMDDLRSLLKDFSVQESTSPENRVQIFKGISKALYKADKLIYTVTLMSEKERDTKLGDVAVRLERVRNCLLPYRFKAKTEEDLSGVYTAIGEMEKGVAVLDKILERDKEMRPRRAKQEAGWKKD